METDLYKSDFIDEFDTSGSNQSLMRQRNERLVLTILRRQGPLPKADIARKTGLSAQTVSVIMLALERDGLLERGEKLRGKIGQPSIPMRLAPQGAFVFGLKVGRRSAELSLVNFVGEEVAHLIQTYDYPTPELTLNFATSAVRELSQNLTPAQRHRIAGIGIAAPFFLWEWAGMIGVEPAKMAAWKGFDLCAEIARHFDFPAYLGNDASCACSAELTFGTTETPPDFLYLYIGYFVGGGLALNGTLFTGRSGNAGAIGPFPVITRDGAQTQLVNAASLIGLERRLEHRDGDASHIVTQSKSWHIDEDVLEDWLNEAVPALARCVVGAISIIDLPAVLLDGNMPVTLRAKIVERLRAAIHDLPLSGLVPPEIREGSLGARARPLGAASLPLSKRFMLDS